MLAKGSKTEKCGGSYPQWGKMPFDEEIGDY